MPPSLTIEWPGRSRSLHDSAKRAFHFNGKRERS